MILCRASERRLCYHGGRLKFLERALNVMLAIALVVVASAVALVWHEYDRLSGLAIHEAEAAVAQSTGLKVRIGSLGGFWWHRFEAKDVRVYASADPGSPLLAYVPLVKARYSPLALLEMSGKPIRIDIDDPIIRLRRDAKGRLDLHLKPFKGPTPSFKSPVGVHVAVHDGIAFWEDDDKATSSQTIPFKQTFDDLSADVTWAGGQIVYHAQGRDKNTSFEADGAHRLDSTRGRLDVRVTALDVPTWAGYGAANDSYRFEAGTADVLAGISYDLRRPKALKVRGKVLLSGLTFAYEDVESPIEHVHGSLSFDLSRVRIDDMAGDILGNAFSGSGQVLLTSRTATGDLDPTLDLSISVPRANLAVLPKVMPEFTAFAPSGSGQATVRVTGSALAPTIAIAAKVDKAVLLKETLGPGTAKALVHGYTVAIHDIAADVQGGTARGTLSFTTDQHPVIHGDLDFTGVGLHELLTPLLTKPLPLDGRADGHVTVSGPLADIDVRGTARIDRGSYGRQAIAGGTVAFRYHRGNIDLPAISLRLPGRGRIQASGGMDGSGDLALHVAGQNLDLAGLRRAGFPVDVTGSASGSFDLAGAVDDPDSWEIAGTLSGRDGVAYGEKVAAVSGAFQLVDGTITLSNVVGRTAGATVLGGGTIGPVSFERKLGPPDVRLGLDVRGADLSRIGPLVALASPSLGDIQGQASVVDGHVDFVGGQLAVSGDLVASRPSVADIGRLSACSGRFLLTRRGLWLTGARLRTGRSEVDVDGRLGFGPDAPFDLHVRTTGADARALLAAPAWPTLLQQTWLGGHLAPEAKGPERLYAELPGRQGVTLKPTPPLDLWPIYTHWDALTAHLPRTRASDIFLVTRYPFWKAIDGKLDADIHLSGTPAHPAVSARARLSGGKAYGRQLAKAVLAVQASGNQLDIGQFEVDLADGGSLAIQGALGKGQRVVANAQDLDLSWLDPWLRAQQVTLEGKVGGQIVLSGDLAHPNLTISANARSGSIDDFVFDRATAMATLADGMLTIDQLAFEKGGKQALLSGTVPVGLRPEASNLDLSVDVEGSSLGILSVLTHDAVVLKGGEGSLKVRVLGTEAAPRLAGGLELKGATLDVVGLKGDLTDVDAIVLIGNGIVTVENSTATYGKGSLDAVGYVTLERFQPDRCNLQLTAQHVDIALQNGLYKGKADAALHVGGRFVRPSLAGMVSLSHGTVTLPVPESAGGNDIPVDLDGVALNIKKSVNVYQQNLMNLNLAGNLIINGTLARPDPRGVIMIVPGGTITTFYTNEFRVAHGSVDFSAPSEAQAAAAAVTADGPESFDRFAQSSGEPANGSESQGVQNARIDVVANSTVTDYDGLQGPDSKGRQVKIVATVTGTLSHMQTHFTSDPPDYTESEIESMLGGLSFLNNALNLGASGSLQPQDVPRYFLPGVADFFFKRYVDSLLDPYISQFFSDYSVNVVNDFAELQQQGGGTDQTVTSDQTGQGGQNQGLLAGYDLALSLATVQLRELPVVGKWPVFSALPLTVSYGHTFRFSRLHDLDSVGLNYRLPFSPQIFSIPLGVTLSGLIETNDHTALPGPTLFPLGIPLEFPTNPAASVVTAGQINLQGRF